MSAMMQALCCVCGNLRTCRQPRNHRRENYWLRGAVDLDWHRETGDLKCDECRRVTTHALIHPPTDAHRDHAERLTNVALGGDDPVDTATKDHVIESYRQSNYPANPYVNHRWWTKDEKAAREAGKTWFRAMCGEPVAVPESEEKSCSITGFAAPTQLTDPEQTEHENLDVESGLWWSEAGTCVNCLRVRNKEHVARRRKLLSEWLVWIYARPDERVPDEHVELLIAAFEATQKNSDQQDATTRQNEA